MKKFLYNLLFPLCIVAILLGSIITVSLNRGFYSRQYEKNDAPLFTGLSLEDLDSVTDNLLDYLVGARDNLDMQAKVKNQVREVFDQREKAHMIDVQRLYINVLYLELALIVGAGLILALLYTDKDKKGLKSALFARYKVTLGVSFLFTLCIGTVFIFNFNWFWTTFHHVFFSNDLWLLDPNVSVMINMFPLEFFFSMCTKILIGFFCGCMVIYLLLMPKKWHKQSEKIQENQN
ncbi:MAG: TIGR01906 family membrane protein [Oscillospiraceae bacterium]